MNVKELHYTLRVDASTMQAIMESVEAAVRSLQAENARLREAMERSLDYFDEGHWGKAGVIIRGALKRTPAVELDILLASFHAGA